MLTQVKPRSIIISPHPQPEVLDLFFPFHVHERRICPLWSILLSFMTLIAIQTWTFLCLEGYCARIVYLLWALWMSWALLSVSSCGKCVLGRTRRFWEQEQFTLSPCHGLCPGCNLWLLGWKRTNAETWLWNPFHFLTNQIWLSIPLIETQWLHQIERNVPLFMLSGVIPGTEFNVQRLLVVIIPLPPNSWSGIYIM